MRRLSCTRNLPDPIRSGRQTAPAFFDAMKVSLAQALAKIAQIKFILIDAEDGDANGTV